MENLPHSQHPNMLSKKHFTNPSKTVYNDVFGGPPRFGVAPTLSPRVEDYSEIFGGFHAPCGASSSIPVLDLPLVDNEVAEDVFFDVRSCSGFDYNEVFGGFNGSDFAVSFEELTMKESEGRGYSSDEAWTPEDPEYLSEDSDNSTKNQCLLNGDSHESIEGSMEFNISYHKAAQSSNEPNGITYVTQPLDVPGYAFMVDKTMSLPKSDDEHPPLQVSDDGHLNIDFTGEMLGEKKLRKTMSYPANGSADDLVFGNEVRPHKEYVRNGSLPNEMFVTISDVSLKTHPSQLPPPSRPPPALDVEKRDSCKSTPNCQSAASSGSAGDSSPPYFDVEVDASSSAAASAAAIKEAMEKAQVKLKSAKELMDRKRGGFQNLTKLGSKNDRKDREGRVVKLVDMSDGTKYEGEQGTCESEENGMDDRQKVTIPDSLGKRHLNTAKKSDEKHGRESLSPQGSDKIDEAGEWKEATQFFELVRTNVPRKVVDLANNDNCFLQNTNIHEQGQKEKRTQISVESSRLKLENGKKVQAITADHELDALEVRATGIPYVFAPCIAVCKDPRWGRCYESYSEDHKLVEAMTEIIPGLQGDIPAKSRKGVPYVGGKKKVAACAKHFVGDGGTTKGINEDNTVIDKHGLFSIHMPAYSDSIIKGVSTVMVSYSSWNGEKMHANRELITGYLKHTLKFKGFVISDWQGIDKITSPPHANYSYSVQASIQAGIDMVMLPFNHTEFIDDLTYLVKSNVIPMDRIDDAVRRILLVKFNLGLFENPLADFSLVNELGSKAHRDLAREAVRKSLVLLKNGKNKTDPLLPLPRKVSKILVAGTHADNLGYQCGGWTIHWQGFSGNEYTSGTTILGAIKYTVDPSTEVVFQENPDSQFIKDNHFAYAIVVVGEPPYAETAGDSMDLKMIDPGPSVISNVCEAVKCVVVVISGRPLVIEPYLSSIDALVAAWLPGTEGQGITDALFGDHGFTGKLPRTWFKNVDQLPMNVGDRHYDPLFPFNFGLKTNSAPDFVGRSTSSGIIGRPYAFLLMISVIFSLCS